MSFDGLCFSFMLRSSLFLVWQIIFNWSLHILGIMRILFLLIPSVRAGLFSQCHCRGGGALPYYCEDGVEVQFFPLASIDIPKGRKDSLLGVGREGNTTLLLLGKCRSLGSSLGPADTTLAGEEGCLITVPHMVSSQLIPQCSGLTTTE